jgi:hypothetical protein
MILLLVQVVSGNLFDEHVLFGIIWLELCCRILQQTRRICMWELPLPVGSWFWIMNIFTVVIYVTYMLYIYNVILLVYIYMSLKTNPKIPGGHHLWWRLGIPHFTKPTYSKHSHVPKANSPSRVEVWQNLWNKENTWTRH